jgi:hypothetical protein
MTWVKLDQHANEHEKLVSAGGEACWLWACGLMYCNRQPKRTGFIPVAQVKSLYAGYAQKLSAKLAKELVRTGLWTPAEGGYLVHDYHVYQPKADVSAVRAEAGRTGGLRSGETRRSKAEANSKQVASAVASDFEAPPAQARAQPRAGPVPVLLLSSDPDRSEEQAGAAHSNGDAAQPSQEPADESGYDLALRCLLEAWQARYGEPYVLSPHTGPKSEAAALMRIGRKALELSGGGDASEQIMRHWAEAYLADDDPWLAKRRHSFRWLEDRVNEYGSRPSRGDSEPPAQDPQDVEARRLARQPVTRPTPEQLAKVKASLTFGKSSP